MGGNEDLGCEIGQGLAGVADDGLEQRSVEMEASHHQVEVVDAGEPAGVAADVHDAGMPAAGEDD